VSTPRSETLRVLAQRVADAFPLEVVEIVLTGSVSRGVADDVSDIEMLAVTEELLSLEQASSRPRSGLPRASSPLRSNRSAPRSGSRPRSRNPTRAQRCAR